MEIQDFNRIIELSNVKLTEDDLEQYYLGFKGSKERFTDWVIGLEFYKIADTIFIEISKQGKEKIYRLKELLKNNNNLDVFLKIFIKKGIITGVEKNLSIEEKKFVVDSAIKDYFGKNKPPFDVIIKSNKVEINKETDKNYG